MMLNFFAFLEGFGGKIKIKIENFFIYHLQIDSQIELINRTILLRTIFQNNLRN